MSEISDIQKNTLSFTTLATPEHDYLGALELAKKHGFDGVDLRVSDYMGEIPESAPDGEISRIREAFDKSGKRVFGLMAYGMSLSLDRSELKNKLRRHLEISEILGCDIVRLHTGNLNMFSDKARYIKDYSDILKETLDGYGGNVSIGIQNHKSDSNTDETLEIIERVSDPRMGIIFSPDHCEGIANNWWAVVKSVAPYTKQLYIADIKGDKNIAPGEGDLPLKEIASEYWKKGGMCFSFKWERIWCKELDDPDTVFPKFMKFIDGINSR